MSNFKASITHQSVTNNIMTSLEFFEKIGDTVINLCVRWWVVRAHPEIKNIGYQNIVYDALKGTWYLGKIGIEKGWVDVVKVRRDAMNKLENMARKIGKLADLSEYVKIYEDSVESFFGCLVYSMLDDGKTFGAAIEVSNQIFLWMIETTHFNGPDEPPGMPTSYKDVYDPITILRNLYQDKASGLRWNHELAYDRKIRDGYYEGDVWIPPAWKWTVYHWDNAGPIKEEENSKSVYNINNREVLYESDWVYDDDKDGMTSKKAANRTALKLLESGVTSEGKKIKPHPVTMEVNPSNEVKQWKGFYYVHYQEQEKKASKIRDQKGSRVSREPYRPQGGGYQKPPYRPSERPPQPQPRYQETPSWTAGPSRQKQDMSDWL